MNVNLSAYAYRHFYHWKYMCIAWFYKSKLLYREFLEYDANACGFWFVMKSAPPGRQQRPLNLNVQRKLAKSKEVLINFEQVKEEGQQIRV